MARPCAGRYNCRHMCDPLTFDNITPEKFAALQRKAETDSGIRVEADSGSASAEGITVRWDYDRAAGKLTMQCTDKPMFIPCGLVNTKIEGLVED